MSLFSIQKRPTVRYGKKGRTWGTGQIKTLGNLHLEVAATQFQSNTEDETESPEINVEEEHPIEDLSLESEPSARSECLRPKLQLPAKQVMSNARQTQRSTTSASRGKGKEKQRNISQDHDQNDFVPMLVSSPAKVQINPPRHASPEDMVQVVIYKKVLGNDPARQLRNLGKRRTEYSESDTSASESPYTRPSPCHLPGSSPTEPHKSYLNHSPLSSPSPTKRYATTPPILRKKPSFPSLSITSSSPTVVNSSPPDSVLEDLLEPSTADRSQSSNLKRRSLRNQMIARSDMDSDTDSPCELSV